MINNNFAVHINIHGNTTILSTDDSYSKATAVAQEYADEEREACEIWERVAVVNPQEASYNMYPNGVVPGTDFPYSLHPETTISGIL